MAQLGIQAFNFRNGYPQQTKAFILLMSLSNADMTVVIAGQTLTAKTSGGTVAWVATDSDHVNSPAGYTAELLVTGLASTITEYPYTTEQGGTTYTGTTYTAPADDTEDFCIISGTCDNITDDGVYPDLKAYVQASAVPVIGMVHIDDIGYVDIKSSDLVGPPNTATNDYSWAVAYFALHGLYAADTYGLYEDRIWAMRNLNFIPQWGDHEFFNDLGWSNTTADKYTGGPGADGSTPYDDLFHKTDPATGGFDGYAYVMYHKFFGTLQPPQPSGAVDTDANSWAITLGGLHIAALDSITNGDGAGTKPASTWYGIQQIDDINKSFNDAQCPFNILYTCNSIREGAAGGGGNVKYLATIAETQADHIRMFTASGNTPPSLMDGDYTNGKLGSLLVLQGDVHFGAITLNKNTTGALDEWFYNVVMGGYNRDHLSAAGFDEEGVANDGATTIYKQDITEDDSDHFVATIYRGSIFPKELEIDMHRKGIGSVFNKRQIHQKTGNDLVDIDYVITTVSTGID